MEMEAKVGVMCLWAKDAKDPGSHGKLERGIRFSLRTSRSNQRC